MRNVASTDGLNVMQLLQYPRCDYGSHAGHPPIEPAVGPEPDSLRSMARTPGPPAAPSTANPPHRPGSETLEMHPAATERVMSDRCDRRKGGDGAAGATALLAIGPSMNDPCATIHSGTELGWHPATHRSCPMADGQQVHEERTGALLAAARRPHRWLFTASFGGPLSRFLTAARRALRRSNAWGASALGRIREEGKGAASRGTEPARGRRR